MIARVAGGLRRLTAAGAGAVAAAYPVELAPGSEERIGEAYVRLSEDGLLEACDPYGCSRVRLRPGDSVLLEPAAPVSRPAALTGCVYVEFEEPAAHPGGSRRLWSLAPYEVTVLYRGTVLARLTPLRAKYTVLGDVVDGVLCRYHRAPVADEAASLLGARSPGEAFLAARIRGSPGLVRGIAFQAAGAPMYSDGEARLYYPLVEAELAAGRVSVKTTAEPPASGLRVAQRGRRVLLFQPVVEYQA